MSGPDRALRKLAADLARAPLDDIEAVLATLGPAHRPSVERLLGEYRSETPALAAVEEPLVIEGLSPWLIARLARRGQRGRPRAGGFGEMIGDEARQAGLLYMMTEAASETLRACALDMKAAVRAPSASPARDVLRRRLFGRRPS